MTTAQLIQTREDMTGWCLAHVYNRAKHTNENMTPVVRAANAQ